MKRFTEMVREFNHRAEISYPTKNREFRAKLINEEVAELREAFDIHAKAPTHESLCNLIKEGCDLIYVLCGTILDFGTPNLFDIYDLDDVERSLPRNKPNEYLMEEIEDFCKLFADGGNIGVYYAGGKVARLLFNYDGSIIEAFTAVHKSNMTKGTNGLPVFVDGKLAKGEDYVKCDLSSIVTKK
jgi:predicted HAD superfamily Cof-like phosphohydrolase